MRPDDDTYLVPPKPGVLCKEVTIRRGVCTEYARHHVAARKARPALLGDHPTGVAGNPPSSPVGQSWLVFVGAVMALPSRHPGGERVGNFAELERSKLERLTELQSRTIEGLGMVLATPAPPETKVEEAGALVRHYQELKDTLLGAGTGSRDASK